MGCQPCVLHRHGKCIHPHKDQPGPVRLWRGKIKTKPAHTLPCCHAWSYTQFLLTDPTYSQLTQSSTFYWAWLTYSLRFRKYTKCVMECPSCRSSTHVATISTSVRKGWCTCWKSWSIQWRWQRTKFEQQQRRRCRLGWQPKPKYRATISYWACT